MEAVNHSFIFLLSRDDCSSPTLFDIETWANLKFCAADQRHVHVEVPELALRQVSQVWQTV